MELDNIVHVYVKHFAGEYLMTRRERSIMINRQQEIVCMVKYFFLKYMNMH